MVHFIDTEFLEGTQKEKFPVSLFRKHTPNTIDLISVGIVAEDSREFYAISKDFNLKEAWNRFEQSDQHRNGKWIKEYWIRENVLKTIWRDLYFQKQQKEQNFVPTKWLPEFKKDLSEGKFDGYFNYKSLRTLIEEYGKTNKQIAIEVLDFCTFGSAMDSLDRTTASIMLFKEMDDYTQKIIQEKKLIHIFDNKPVFYAYYADYDWVVFCWLFGKMVDLPNAFPMYCKDLKQILDEKQPVQHKKTGTAVVVNNAILEYHLDYPKQDPTKCHNALEDARFNKKLYDFINNI